MRALLALPTADFWQTAAFSAGRIIGVSWRWRCLVLAALVAAALGGVLLRPLMLTTNHPRGQFYHSCADAAEQRQTGGVHQLFDGAARGVYEHAGGHP
ncbi:MAG: hypothetical protein ACLR7U_03870 [Ruthenibacterium lactatiformans]